MCWFARVMIWCLRFEQAIGGDLFPKYKLQLHADELYWEDRLHHWQLGQFRRK